MGHSDEPDTTTREESLEVWLDADARAAGEARAIAEDVASRLPAQLRDDVLLVTSELVANAVEHGSGDRVNLRLQVVEPSEDSDSDAGAIEVAVRNDLDGSDLPLPPRPWRMPDPQAVRGRGLAIVQSLAARVRVDLEELEENASTQGVRDSTNRGPATVEIVASVGG